MISEFNTPHPWCFQRLDPQEGLSVQLLVEYTNILIYYDTVADTGNPPGLS